jgi:hypothetical protein
MDKRRAGASNRQRHGADRNRPSPEARFPDWLDVRGRSSQPTPETLAPRVQAHGQRRQLIFLVMIGAAICAYLAYQFMRALFTGRSVSPPAIPG